MGRVDGTVGHAPDQRGCGADATRCRGWNNVPSPPLTKLPVTSLTARHASIASVSWSAFGPRDSELPLARYASIAVAAARSRGVPREVGLFASALANGVDRRGARVHI